MINDRTILITGVTGQQCGAVSGANPATEDRDRSWPTIQANWIAGAPSSSSRTPETSLVDSENLDPRFQRLPRKPEFSGGAFWATNRSCALR
jgi:hypothetical protein